MSIIVGNVSKIEGVVRAINPVTGEVRILEAGSPVYQGEILQTSAKSGVIVDMANGTLLTLGRDTQMRLDDDVSNPSSSVDTGTEGAVDVAALQQAVLEGNFDALEATAAGEALVVGSASDGGVTVERIALSGNVTSGFDTGVGNQAVVNTPRYVGVIDGTPEAIADNNPNTVVEDSLIDTVYGNVFGNDDIGLDASNSAIPVTGVKAGASGTDVVGGVATSVTGTYGSVVINSDGSYTYVLNNSDPDTNGLAEGEKVTDVFTYTITDSNGDSASTTLTINIVGANDVPVIESADDAGAITEIADGATGENTTTLTDTGNINFSDVDLSDAHTLTVTPDATDYVGGLTASITDASTGDGAGAIKWDYAVNDADIDYLAADEQLTQVYEVKVDDGNGGTVTQDVTITITGTNDVPVIESADATGSVTEIADGAAGENTTTLTDTGTIEFTDVDLSDAHTLTVTPNATDYVGGLTASITDVSTGDGAGTIKWDYAVDDSAIDYLTEGQTLEQTYQVEVKDDNGATVSQAVTITITGTNDVPVIESADDTGSVTEIADGAAGENNTTLTDTGMIEFSDVDLSDAHTVTVTAPDNSNYLGSLTATIIDDATGDGTGTIKWDYAVEDSAIDYLTEGQTLEQTYQVEVKDDNGATVSQAVTITITGTNDVPVIESADDTGSVTEIADGAAGENTTTLTDTGTIEFSDVDLSDAHTLTVTPDANNYLGTLTASITDVSTGDGAGTIKWDYAVEDADIDYLAAGETLTQVYEVKVDDGKGGTVTQAVTITITGTNDVPVLTVDSSGSVTEDDSTPSLTDTGTLSIVDVDLIDTHAITTAYKDDLVWSGGTLSAADTATITSGFTVDSDSWDYSVSNSAVQFLAKDETITFSYDVKVDDGNGGTDTEVVVMTITGTNDNPILTVDTIGSVVEDAGSPDLTDSGTLSFTDVDINDTHTVTATYKNDISWDGGTLSNADIATIKNGFSVDANGWDYSVSNSLVQFLAKDETITFSYDVTVEDNNGGTDTKVVEMTITGTNDIPVLTADSSGAVTEDDSTPNLTDSGTLSFTDVDTTDTHTMSSEYKGDLVWSGGSLSAADIATITSGFTVDADSWDYSVSNSDVQFLAEGETLTFSYDVTVNDGNGGTDTKVVDITITGTNDAPVIDLDKDNSTDSGQNYTNIFNEDGAAVSIADSDIEASDVDDSNLESATIVLTNAQANDFLNVGDVDPKFGATVDTSTAGQITVTLTGSYNKADYQEAIKAITFSNSSQTPDETERIIEVTVNDGALDSNTAISTIKVNANPDLIPNAIDVVEGQGSVDETSVDTNSNTVEGNLLNGDDLGTAIGEITSFTYTNTSGKTATGTVGQETTTQYGKITVNADGTWLYTPNQSVQQLAGEPLPEDIINYTVTDGNGDTDTTSFTITLEDGADPTIGIPENETVYEANLVLGSDPDNSALSQTGNLDVIQGTDNIADVVFNANQPGLVNSGNSIYQSGGEDVKFSLSADGHTLTGYTGDISNPVFTVVINDPTDASVDGKDYTFTLIKPLDHTSDDIDSSGNIVIPFSFTASDTDGDIVNSNDTSDNFTVTIVDDVPQDTKTITVNEDEEITFNTTADDSDGSITNIGGASHGTPTVNENGTITYVPNPDFSGTDTFTYDSTNEDGTVTTTTVTVNVTPVADAPDVSRDAAKVYILEDSEIALGFNTPVLKDQIDNSTVANEDNPERLGAITLSGLTEGTEIKDSLGNVLFTATASDNNVTIQLTDAGADYHTAGLTTDLSLTIDQFESLVVKPAADSAKDLKVKLSVDSYEVDDAGTPLTGIAKANSNIKVEVDVLAVTDPVDLKINGDDTSYTTTISEDSALDLSALLSTNVFNDIDGSENRSIVLEGLPDGMIVNGETITGGSYEIDLTGTGNNNLPTISITPPENFSGDINDIIVKLVSHDTDTDSTHTDSSTVGTTTLGNTTIYDTVDSVTLNLNVTPVASDVTISTPENKIEDEAVYLFKQSNGNSIFTLSDTDGSESISQFGILKSQIDALLADGATISGSSYSTVNFDGTDYYVFDNADAQITPPAHSSADITLTYLVETTDTATIDGVVDTAVSHKTADKTIVLSPVAESTQTDSDGDGVNDIITQGSHTYAVSAEEDVYFALNNTNFGLSVANEDSGETTSVLFTPTDGTNALIGTIFKYGNTTIYFNGTAVEIPSSELENLEVKAPENYSGTLELTTQIKAIDSDDDASNPEATSTVISEGDTLTINVAPVADNAILSVSQVVVNEDAGRSNGNTYNDEGSVDPSIIDNPSAGQALNIKVNSVDGSETFEVTIDKLPDGGALYFDYGAGNTLLIDETGTVSSTGTVSGITVTNNADDTWSVVIDGYTNDNQPIFIPPHNSDGTYSLDVSAVTKDGDQTGTPSNVTLKVDVLGIADVPEGVDLNTVTINGQDYEAVYNENEVDATNAINLADIYSAANPNSEIKSYDSDSEQLNIVISDLPVGFAVKNATFIGGTGEDRSWSVSATDIENVLITVPKNYSGELPFTVQYITTEETGSSRTQGTEEVSVWITPQQDSVVNTTLNQVEDVPQVLDFSINQNGDSNEELTKVYIKESSIPSDVTLSVSGGSDLATEATSNADVNLVDGYYEITGSAINNIVSTLTAQSDDDYSLTVKYEVTDHTNTSPDVPTATVSDDTVYSATVTAVADIPTVTPSSTLDTVIAQNDAGQDVTVYDLGTSRTATVTLNLASDDLDGSEVQDYYIFTNVPDGVIVEGAAFGGEGVWYLPASGSTSNGVSTQDVTFQFTTAADIEAVNEITVVGHNLDHDNSKAQSAPVSIYFTGEESTGGGDGETFDAVSISASPVMINEDTTLALSDVFTFTLDPVDGDPDYSLILSGVPDDATVTGGFKQTMDNGDVVWVVGKDAIDTATVVFADNYNQNDYAGESFDLVGKTITNNPDGSTTETPETDAAITIVPITDPFEITPDLTAYDAATGGNEVSSSQEDGRTEINIGVTTPDSSFDYVDASGTLVSSVTLSTDGEVDGTLYNSETGVAYTLNGSDWTIPVADLDKLQFVPEADASGKVTFSITENIKETGATNIVSQTQTIPIDIQAVNDGFDVEANNNSIGNEGELIPLVFSTTGIDIDGSEKIFSASVDEVPDGVLIYYVDSNGDYKLAQNTGSTDGGATNKWSVSLVDGVLPDIYVQAPTYYSGTLASLGLSVYSSETDAAGNAINDMTINSTLLDVTIDPIANPLTIKPTNTFGTEGSELPINLNISMDDVDGSETVSFTLTGNGTTLPEGMTFEVGGVPHSDVTYDSDTGTYTVTGVAFDDIKDIVAKPVEGLKGDINIDVSAWTVDGDSNTSTTPETGSFVLTLYEHASGVTPYSVTTQNVDNSANYVTGEGYQIPLVISDLDLADKDGSESLSVRISGLSSSVTLDESTLPTGVTATQDGADWLIDLGSPTDAHYEDALTALENGDVKLITTSTDGTETDGFNVEAFSTLTSTGETNSDVYDIDSNTSTSSTGESVSINLTVDATGDIDGSSADETLYGSDGSDTIHGAAGSDVLYGGQGDDILAGGAGADTLIGGDGADTFKLTTDDAGTTDTINDFVKGSDLLDLSEVLEGTNQITDANSLNEYLSFAQDGNDTKVTIDSNGKSTADGTIYEVVLKDTLVTDIDEHDILD
ncbi:VCBS domain-containing protein [Thiomicrorhabdus hydrogeniphila]